MTKQTATWHLASNFPVMKAVLSLLLSASSLAEEPILITAPLPPIAQRAQFEALYSAFHYEVANSVGLNTRVQFVPIERARASYERGRADAQMGAACGVMKHTPSRYSVPYTLLTRHLISAGDSKAITELESLRGKTLGVIEKYFYKLPDAEALKAMDITLHHTQDQFTLVKLLLSKRIDAILESVQVAERLRQHLNHSTALRYVEDTPFSRSPLCYVVRDNERGKLLIKRLNKGIRTVYASGKLAKFTAPPFRVPSFEQIEGKITH